MIKKNSELIAQRIRLRAALTSILAFNSKQLENTSRVVSTPIIALKMTHGQIQFIEENTLSFLCKCNILSW